MKEKKICFICSRGGHLVDLEPLISEFNDKNSFVVTEKAKDTESIAKHYLSYFHRKGNNRGVNLFKLIDNVFESIKILNQEKPDYVVSSGAMMCIPFIYLSKLFGLKIIYIECSAQVTEPSYTGKIIYPISDHFFVQWKSLLKKYGKKAEYFGNLLT